MKQLIECSTCGYPLTPEEREGLVEIDGKMCKPRKPLTDDEISSLISTSPPSFAVEIVRIIERAHGIGGKE
jgi:hypothetical protein